MVGVDPEIGGSAVRIWLAAAAAATFFAVCVLVFVRTRTTALTRTTVVVASAALGAVLGAVVASALFGQSTARDHDADRRALQLRAEELTAQSLAPGSALACLNASAGDDVEVACEKALFASPATVAGATSYVLAKLALLSDMVTYVKAGGTNIDNSLAPLRRSLEADRFGFLAHALAVRDGCTSQACKPLDALADASHVRANLSAATLDRYLDHYLTVWAQPSSASVADAAPVQSGAETPPHKMVNIDFPSAASIPAISIMNPEPTGKVLPGVAAAAAANPNPPSLEAAKRPRKQAAGAPPPVAPPSDGQVDPVWSPAPAAAPQPPAPSAPSGASAAAAPMQLSPPVSQQ